MPAPRPFAVAVSVTAIALGFALVPWGGHSPFAKPAASPVALADPVGGIEGAQGGPDGAVGKAGQAEPSTTPDATGETAPADDPAGTASPTTTTTGATGGRSAPTARPSATKAPTSKPGQTAAPTDQPTAAPTSAATAAPTPTPAPVAQRGTLSISVVGGVPQLSWTECTSGAFQAYAVVRSLDAEIHFPAEDKDTVVAMVTSAGTTWMADATTPAGVRVWYRVWALSRNGSEYTTIWSTATVGVQP